MRMPVLSAALLTLTGCAWFGFTPSRTVHAPLLDTLRAGGAVLAP